MPTLDLEKLDLEEPSRARHDQHLSPGASWQVLYYANIHDGVVRGLKEVMQALERGDAQLVFLAEDCDEATYVELIETMCAEKGVYLLKMPEKKALGEMAGNTRLDDDGNVKKSCAASSVAIKDFGEQVLTHPFSHAHAHAGTLSVTAHACAWRLSSHIVTRRRR
jgi:ribosomal protein L7Ae-like RNA K-turn-binding protein